MCFTGGLPSTFENISTTAMRNRLKLGSILDWILHLNYTSREFQVANFAGRITARPLEVTVLVLAQTLPT